MSKVSLSARVYTYIMICMNKFPGSIYERYCGRHVCVSPSINAYTHTQYSTACVEYAPVRALFVHDENSLFLWHCHRQHTLRQLYICHFHLIPATHIDIRIQFLFHHHLCSSTITHNAHRIHNARTHTHARTHARTHAFTIMIYKYVHRSVFVFG